DRLVALHLIADLLQPLRQRPLGDRFAHLGHDDVYACHRITLVPSFACACAHVEGTRSRSSAESPRPQPPHTPRMYTSYTAPPSRPRTDSAARTPQPLQSARRSFHRPRIQRTR